MVIAAAVLEVVPLVLLGTFGVGVASAVGLQARYAASDLAAPEHVGRDLAMVVWATTVGAVLGPNLMQPASALADAVGLPPLSGPYLVTAAADHARRAAGVRAAAARPAAGGAQAGSRPDADTRTRAAPDRAWSPSWRTAPAWCGPRRVRRWRWPRIAVGHVVMVMVMVMTPVHMQHVDVTLQIVGLVISVHILGMYAFSPAGRAGSPTGGGASG